MEFELESLFNKYSQDIDYTDQNQRTKMDVIKELIQNKDWDINIPNNSENKKMPDITQILIYEYSTGIEKITNGKVSYKQVVEKLSNIMGKLRYGEWKQHDGNIKYDEKSVIDPEYRKSEGKSFGAQSIEYIDENNEFKMAVIAYDKNNGEGIDFGNINDIRHTFFHEWTHILELDRVLDNQETEVRLNGRTFKNNEKKENGEIWGAGIVTREYGENAEIFATNVDKNGNKRIMHNQITEGAVELIARKVMGKVLGEEQAEKVIDSTRYVPNVRVVDTIVQVIGEERFITLFTTNSQKLITALEGIDIEGRDALHYMSDFVNDQRIQGMIPEYSPRTNLYREIQQRKLSRQEIQKFLQTDPRVQKILANEREIYSSLSRKIMNGYEESKQISEQKKKDEKEKCK